MYANHSHLYVVSKKYTEYTDKFGGDWLNKIAVGDVLSSVDGVAIGEWEKEVVGLFSGANEEGGYARAIEGLTFR